MKVLFQVSVTYITYYYIRTFNMKLNIAVISLLKKVDMIYKTYTMFFMQLGVALVTNLLEF